MQDCSDFESLCYGSAQISLVSLLPEDGEILGGPKSSGLTASTYVDNIGPRSKLNLSKHKLNPSFPRPLIMIDLVL